MYERCACGLFSNAFRAFAWWDDDNHDKSQSEMSTSWDRESNPRPAKYEAGVLTTTDTLNFQLGLLYCRLPIRKMLKALM